ncbi:CHAT domain-containing protein [Kitasatospora sp. HPMI-4]|uniref:CHAT domain-containing protein n=1 Tax=Kitasatospora sp. HPMI-4 TaxID=3448443 RepID=UPI003F1DD2C5
MTWREHEQRAQELLWEGEVEGAAEAYCTALRIAGAVPLGATDGEETVARVRLVRSVARVLTTVGRFEPARDALRTYLGQVPAGHPEARRCVSLLLAGLASVQRELGDNAGALEALTRALAPARATAAQPSAEDIEALAHVLLDRGLALKDLGRIGEADRDLTEARQLAERIGHHSLLGHARTGLGLLAVLLNDLPAAERHYLAAHRAYQAVPDGENISVVLHNLGVLYERQRHYRDAARHFEQALALDRRLDSPVGIADNLSALGGLAQVFDRPAEAARLHRKALELYRGTGHLRGVITTLVDLAICVRQEGPGAAPDGDGQPSVDHLLAEALRLAEQVGDPRDIADVQFVQGDSFLLAGRTDDAFARYLAAARVQSRLRSGMSEDEALKYFDESRGDEILDRLVRLSAGKDNARALLSADAAKGRELVRRMAESGGRPGRASVEDLSTVDPELALFREEVDPWYGGIRALLAARELPADPRTGEDATTSPGRFLIEYHIADDTAVVFGCGPDDTVPRATSVPITRDRFREAVRRWFGGDGDGVGPRGADRGVWLEMMAPLVAPISEWTVPGQPIVVIPHDALHGVPLHAVPVQGMPLGLRNPLSYAPSATVLCHIAARATTTPSTGAGPALVVDASGHDRSLVFAREQARTAAEALSGDRTVTLLPDAPSRGDVLRALRRSGGPGIVHIAGHGTFDAQQPMMSGIPLGGRSLTARDIARLELRCTLVTVGACSSGVALRRPGDELIGLARALLIAGADALLVSLWRVDQLSTALLLQEFYRAWLHDRAPKAEALRRAQLHVADLTAAEVLAYARRARERSHGDSPDDVHTRAALALAAGEVACAARDFALAETLAAEAEAGAGPLLPAERRRAERLALQAAIGAAQGTPPDPERRIFRHPRHWAAFMLVGLGD